MNRYSRKRQFLGKASLLVVLAATTCLALAGPSPMTQEREKGPKRDKDAIDSLPPYVGPKHRITVQEIEIKTAAPASGGTAPTSDPNSQALQGQLTPPTDFGQGLSEMLVTALSRTNRFLVLERSDKGLADMVKEQNQAGVTEATKVQANNLLGAEVLIRGSLTEFTLQKSQSGGNSLLSGIGVTQASASSTVGIDIRIFDASTGEIIDSERAEGTASSKGLQFSVDKGDYNASSSSFQNSCLGKATREAISKAVLFICRKMDNRPWQARVADVVDDEADKKQLYLNVGSTAGIKVGDEFEVFHPGHTLIDPDHPGRVLSITKGKKVGRCRVTSVEPTISVAEPIEGDGFAAKDYVRLPDVPKKPPATN